LATAAVNSSHVIYWSWKRKRKLQKKISLRSKCWKKLV